MSVSSEAGAMAEEAIMDVKTVAACNAQKHMVKVGSVMETCSRAIAIRSEPILHVQNNRIKERNTEKKTKELTCSYL